MLFETALGCYSKGDYKNTRLFAYQAIERDPSFIEPYLLLADIENELQNYKAEIEITEKIIKIDPKYNPKLYLNLAKAQLFTGIYEPACANLEKFLSFDNPEKELISNAEKLLITAEFGREAVKNPVPFKPVNIGSFVNTNYKDYWPSLTADEKTLIFTSQLPTGRRSITGAQVMQEDFFITHRNDDGNWSPSYNPGPPLNTPDNEGAQGISADGRFLFYTACNREGDYGSCDIYFAEKVGGKWSAPQNTGPPVSTEQWESNPSPSSDGRMLFFAAGGKNDSRGGRDIYFTKKNSEGKWCEPVNLGDSINTKGNEYAPFIHPDGKTLYFSSDGFPGMGGQDIYVTRLREEGTWSTPKNLGFPINTHADDFGLIVNLQGNYAYYSSNREGSADWDIYGFELFEEARPNTVTYVTGTVADAVTMKKLGARIEIINIATLDTVTKLKSDMIDGSYLACIPAGNNYAMNVSMEGYLFMSENFSLALSGDSIGRYNLDVLLQPIIKGKSTVLRNIFFETDSYELKPESKAELAFLIKFLNEYKNISVEISGHTDNSGTYEYNLKLSHNRAKTVSEYIILNGISGKRVSYKGYSFSKPIATNENEEGKALNRRTEMVVTSVN